MTLEQEMRQEVKRLEEELIELDKKLEKTNSELEKLNTYKRKCERELRILKSNFGENEKQELQTTLAGNL
tara:strand:- start:48 stop:257 length:210 start_codon:yes stop_codon:yes gene_type:complete